MQSSRGTRQWAGDKSRDLRGKRTEGIRQTDGGNRLTADKGEQSRWDRGPGDRHAFIGAPEARERPELEKYLKKQ